MGLFKKKYYFLESTNKNTGRPILFGALRNRGSDGKIGKGDYCKNEVEASRAAADVLRHRIFEIKIAHNPDVTEATKEWKGEKLIATGDLEEASQRIGHKIDDKRFKKDDDSSDDYETEELNEL